MNESDVKAITCLKKKKKKFLKTKKTLKILKIKFFL
jgi:hypothetical protein